MFFVVCGTLYTDNIENFPFDLFSLVRVQLYVKNITSGGYCSRPMETYCNDLEYFSLSQKKEFLDILLKNHNILTKKYLTNDIKNETRETSMKSCYQLIVYCIKSIIKSGDETYIIEHINDWYFILYGQGREETETKIKKEIIPGHETNQLAESTENCNWTII